MLSEEPLNKTSYPSWYKPVLPVSKKLSKESQSDCSLWEPFALVVFNTHQAVREQAETNDF